MAHGAHPGGITILFGAFDRHNLGDLLLPHVVAALLPGRELLLAGLVERDLRPWGGHRVRALPRLVTELGDTPIKLIHVGGELLTCDLWQAAVMLLAPEEARRTVARLDAHPAERLEWARRQLGIAALAPYSVPRQRLGPTARVIYCGVGGADLDRAAPALRAEVVANLRAADGVGVRDRRILAHLTAEGVAARLMPDPAVMVASLFGAAIRHRAQFSEVARIRTAFPAGYLAVQFSADFGDDASLDEIARQLEQAARATGLGVVFFLAGAAPWHDDLDCYWRTASRMRSGAPRLFTSLDIWDICGLIAHSRAYCGSSLHGRIVAMALALPRLNLRHPTQSGQVTKHDAFADTWEAPGTLAAVEVHELAEGIHQALAAQAATLHDMARATAAQFRAEFAVIGSHLDADRLP